MLVFTIVNFSFIQQFDTDNSLLSKPKKPGRREREKIKAATAPAPEEDDSETPEVLVKYEPFTYKVSLPAQVNNFYFYNNG